MHIMLPFLMLVASLSLLSFWLKPLSSLFSVTSAISVLRASRALTTQLCAVSATTQLFPSFSTPSRHLTRNNTRNSHAPSASLHAPGHVIHGDPSPLPLAFCAPINPLESMFTKPPVDVDSKQFTRTLNSLYATLTKIAGGASPLIRVLSFPYVLASLPSYFNSATLLPPSTP